MYGLGATGFALVSFFAFLGPGDPAPLIYLVFTSLKVGQSDLRVLNLGVS